MMIRDDLPIFRGYNPIKSLAPIYLDLSGDPHGNYNVLGGRRGRQNTFLED
jgi:hypothetical protein